MGSVEAAALMADCTSWAAASMSRPSSNCSVIWLSPNELCDAMVDSDGIWPNCRSSDAVTSETMVDLDGREIDLGQGRDGKLAVAEDAGQ